MQNKIRNQNTINRIRQKYSCKNQIASHLERLKQQAAAQAYKLKLYKRNAEFKRVNKQFEGNQKEFYQSLSHVKNSSKQALSNENHEEALNFWKNIWEIPVLCPNKKDLLNYNMPCTFSQSSIVINMADVKQNLKKASNFKSPGPDGIQNIILKNLTNLHSSIVAIFNDLIKSQSVPSWLLAGNTFLLQKKEQANFEVSNYRPITCLSTIWKLFSGIIAKKIYNHLEISNQIPPEQKGCIRKSLGTTEQLLIDRTVTDHAAFHQRNLHVAWIDYRKAFDSVSHEWIFTCLEEMKVNNQIIGLLKQVFTLFSTNLFINGDNIGQVKIQRGIYQGDSLSPLLFIMSLFCISHLLNSTGKGYSLKKADQKFNVTHLFFVDDLKIYSSSEKDLRNMVNCVETFSNEIGLFFGLSKCATAVSKGTKQSNGYDIVTNEGVIAPLNDTYKYLGIYQQSRTNDQKTKSTLTNEYYKRTKEILTKNLNGKNTIIALNTYALPCITYGSAAIKWTDTELNEIDTKTRKLLNEKRAFHKNSCVHRLYMHRKDGGRGLKSVTDQVNKTRYATLKNIKERAETNLFLKIINVDDEIFERKINHSELVYRKPLHGQFLNDNKSNHLTFAWLKSCNLPKEIESTIFAAQEQCIPTNSYIVKIQKGPGSVKCRFCNQSEETIKHILSSCPTLAANDYITRHNEVGKVVLKSFQRYFGLKSCDSVTSQTVFENSKGKILWDFSIQTNKKFAHNRPDMVVVDKKAKNAILFDFSFPWDTNIDSKYREKVSKYIPLATEIRTLWNLKNIQIQPVIIGCLGSCTKQMKQELSRLEVSIQITNLQECLLKETCKIIKRLNLKL